VFIVVDAFIIFLFEHVQKIVKNGVYPNILCSHIKFREKKISFVAHVKEDAPYKLVDKSWCGHITKFTNIGLE
jgi:hypothetical protein